MKILIFTQKVDRNDDVLGFFHRWLFEFAKKFEQITVICLEKGEMNLPANVKVLSLGKEGGKSRRKYVGRFYKLIYSLKNEYDVVFVHMNQEYVLLGGILWRLWGKRIAMWRNHKKGNFLTKIAVHLSDKVFCTSPASFTAKFPKTSIMPVGIDTELFKKDSRINKKPNSILSLGRISPVKNVEKIVDVAVNLKTKKNDFLLSIYGFAKSHEDERYLGHIKRKTGDLEKDGNIKFYPGVINDEAAKIYNEHEIFINLTPDGSFDKTMFEAMACGSLLITCNSGLFDVLPKELQCELGRSEETADKIKAALEMTEAQKNEITSKLTKYIEDNQSLKKLVEKIEVYFNAMK